ncbi:hypothetical protein, partial [Salmonella sp. s51933]|uniref:hypothetical protein n=1 Tax=Salmonella sp. s51933 TaxID=3160127 RepID=UPI0037551DC1
EFSAQREMLKKTKIGFIKFQRLFRRYREKTHQERTETRWRREKELKEDISRKRVFRPERNAEEDKDRFYKISKTFTAL